MTCAQYRETPELVSEMRKLLENPALAMWLEAMDNTNPAKKAAPVGIQSHDAFIMLGEQTGWMDYRDRFRLGGTAIEQPPKQEEQTYAEPPPEPE